MKCLSYIYFNLWMTGQTVSFFSETVSVTGLVDIHPEYKQSQTFLDVGRRLLNTFLFIRKICLVVVWEKLSMHVQFKLTENR